MEPTERRVAGILLYNVFEPGMAMARRIISDRRAIADFGELVKLFDVFGEAAASMEATTEEQEGDEDDEAGIEEADAFMGGVGREEESQAPPPRPPSPNANEEKDGEEKD